YLEHNIKNYESNHYKFQLIEHLINSKFWMMIYMEGYLCAYEYWTLSKPEIKPSIIKTFQDLEKDMNKIRDELEKHMYNLDMSVRYLEGVGSENEIISLCISNTCTLANRDKKKNQIHNFRAKPIPANEFRYRESSSLNSSEFNKTEKYIDYDNKYKNNDKIYFVPTPFCQWKISLNTKNDFSELRSINIHLVTYCHLIV
ncbi:17460_t:CDS:2, partial [Gigaspora rosea]